MTANKHVAESAKFLDFHFSKEGTLLKYFGIEGQTYTMVNNEPVYTDHIKKNPEGLPIMDAIAKYCRDGNPSPGFNGMASFVNMKNLQRILRS